MTHKIIGDGVRWITSVRHRFGVATLGAFVFVGAPLVAFAGHGVYNHATSPAATESSSAEQASTGHTPLPNATDSTEPDQQSATDVSLEVTTKPGQKPEVSAHINGEPVTLPNSGSNTKHVHQNTGQSVIDITVEGQGNSSSYVHSSTSIEVNGQSYSNSTGSSNVSGDEGRHPRRR